MLQWQSYYRRSPKSGWHRSKVNEKVVSAFFASACFILPVLLAGVAGVAGVASFTEPLRPLFLGIAVVFLGYGFYTAYFKKASECGEGESCATDIGRHRQRIILWVVAIMVIGISTFPYWVGCFL
jgi:mercuric ion transport protein